MTRRKTILKIVKKLQIFKTMTNRATGESVVDVKPTFGIITTQDLWFSLEF